VPAEIVRINSQNPEPRLIAYTAEQIRGGAVVGMPTDTFYGLAADPLNLRAVEQIYFLKTRSKHKPLSLMVESVDQAEDLARPQSAELYALARKYWPGPLTMIVRASSRLPLKVTANTGNVALRVPACTIALEVVRAAGLPITATSANVSGASESTTVEGVREQLGFQLPLIVDGGPTPRAVPTTILDLSSGDGRWRLPGSGAIAKKEIAEYLGEQ
jgi:tRNA threonylcarbamoyl adenosine modification protein (Sua5/YciO/YrdC/YwlC family)